MSKKKKESRLTVGDLINDAYLTLDGDTAPIVEDSIPFNTGIRLLNRVVHQVLTYRNWSFMRERLTFDLCGPIHIEDEYEVVRVMDSWGRVFNRVYYPTPRAGEYNILEDLLLVGPPIASTPFIVVEVMPYFKKYKKAKSRIHPKLYDVLVMGLSAELAKIDDGYRATATEKEADYMDRLKIAARRDMREAGDGVIF